MVAASGSSPTPPAPPAPDKGGFTLTNLTAGNWLAIALVVAAAAFIFQNRDRVTIDVFHIGIQLPLWLSLGVMFAAGWLSGRFWRRGKRAA